MTTFVQRCTRCYQPWGGWIGSICNECKIFEQQQKSFSEQQRLTEEADRRFRSRQETVYAPAPAISDLTNEELVMVNIFNDWLSEEQKKNYRQPNLWSRFWNSNFGQGFLILSTSVAILLFAGIMYYLLALAVINL
jgi:hypothetical protein